MATGSHDRCSVRLGQLETGHIQHRFGCPDVLLDLPFYRVICDIMKCLLMIITCLFLRCILMILKELHKFIWSVYFSQMRYNVRYFYWLKYICLQFEKLRWYLGDLKKCGVLMICVAGWKGQASYYTIEVDGKENKDAAWFYPSPKPAAQNIKVLKFL